MQVVTFIGQVPCVYFIHYSLRVLPEIMFCPKLSFVRIRVMAEFLLKWERTSQTQVQVHQSLFSSIPI